MQSFPPTEQRKTQQTNGLSTLHHNVQLRVDLQDQASKENDNVDHDYNYHYYNDDDYDNDDDYSETADDVTFDDAKNAWSACQVWIGDDCPSSGGSEEHAVRRSVAHQKAREEDSGGQRGDFWQMALAGVSPEDLLFWLFQHASMRRSDP